MCSNYRLVTRMDRLLALFGVEYGKGEVERDVYPLGDASFIRLSDEGQEGGRPALVGESGMFGPQRQLLELIDHHAGRVLMRTHAMSKMVPRAGLEPACP
jgi:hypothetical protein